LLAHEQLLTAGAAQLRNPYEIELPARLATYAADELLPLPRWSVRILFLNRSFIFSFKYRCVFHTAL